MLKIALEENSILYFFPSLGHQCSQANRGQNCLISDVHINPSKEHAHDEAVRIIYPTPTRQFADPAPLSLGRARNKNAYHGQAPRCQITRSIKDLPRERTQQLENETPRPWLLIPG